MPRGKSNKQDEQMKEITEQLEKGVEQFFTSDRYTEYLNTMSKFHDYSINNTLLIAMQKPDATFVAGYGAWNKNFNRHVLKGEKGIKIIAPNPIKITTETEKIDKITGNPILDENGDPVTEDVVSLVPHFKVTTVFDVSQTDGDPLPDLGIEDLSGNVENYGMFQAVLKEVSPVPIRYDDIPGTAKGYYDLANKEIVIQPGMSESQTLKTTIHEITHSKLHDRDVMKENGVEKDRLTREVEAESVAYIVCNHFGIDTSDYSFPYIASWSSGKELKELQESMETIKVTSSEFIDEISEAFEKQNELSEDLEEAELFGVPILFSEDRVEDSHVLEGLNKYDLRGSDRDIDIPVTIENNVKINHAGTILTAYPLDMELPSNRGFLRLGNELKFTSNKISAEEYLKTESSKFRNKDETLEEMEFPIVRANEDLALTDYGGAEHYAIYQLKDEYLRPEQNYLFMNYDYTKEHNIRIQGADYKLMYGGVLENESWTLDDMYTKFNAERPSNFEGHSLSVSDVIVTNHDGHIRAWYVDSFGFKELPDFIKERKDLIDQKRQEDFTFGMEYNFADMLECTDDQTRYLEIVKGTDALHYSFYDSDFKLISDGEYDNLYAPMTEIRDDVLNIAPFNVHQIAEMNYDVFFENVGIQDEASTFAHDFSKFYQKQDYPDEYFHIPNNQDFSNADEIKAVLLSGDDSIIRELLETTAEEPEYVTNARQLLNRLDYIEKKTADWQPTISFYAAECMEFTSMGKYYSGLTLEEAIEAYEKIPSDRMNAGKGIGFEIHDGSIYDGMEYPLMDSGKVDLNNVNMIEHFKNNALVQDALKQLSAVYPVRESDNWQKAYENGEYLRSSEMTEEQNYNMIDGLKNNTVPKEKPKYKEYETKPSVIEKLHEKEEEIREKYNEIERPERVKHAELVR